MTLIAALIVLHTGALTAVLLAAKFSVVRVDDRPQQPESPWQERWLPAEAPAHEAWL